VASSIEGGAALFGEAQGGPPFLMAGGLAVAVSACAHQWREGESMAGRRRGAAAGCGSAAGAAGAGPMTAMTQAEARRLFWRRWIG
jgi:hypothetical protein